MLIQLVSATNPKPGDLVKFILPENNKWTNSVCGIKIPASEAAADMQHYIKYWHQYAEAGVHFTDFAVVIEVLANGRNQNYWWKVLHPEHGMLFVAGVSHWRCEVISWNSP